MHILYPDFHDEPSNKKYSSNEASRSERLHTNYISLVITLNLEKKSALAMMGQNYGMNNHRNCIKQSHHLSKMF